MEYNIVGDSKILIGIAGPPSSHKTTTAQLLRSAIHGSKDTVKEYARHYIEKHGRITGPSGQLMVFDGQSKWEDQAFRNYQLVISDSPRWLSFIYATDMFKIKDSEERAQLVRLYELCLDATLLYDVIYVLAPRPVVLDGVRKQSDADAERIFDKIVSFLEWHHVEFQIVDDADNNHRIEWVLNDLVERTILEDLRNVSEK